MDARFRQSFSVEYRYDVLFTRGLFAPGNELLASLVEPSAGSAPPALAVFADDGVLRAMPPLAAAIERHVRDRPHRMRLAAPVVLVPGGEVAKNDPAVLRAVQQRMIELRIDRHSYVLAIGGGAVLDVVGFAAAVVHRGLRHIRVPTTTLAQADSGVGVKNGVNVGGKKNILGCFAPPHAVVNDSDFLDAQPARERTAGLAEAVKVALIRDAGFFNWLEQHADALARGEAQALAVAVRRCAELHMAQIARGGDPFERGNGRPLDYGHWSAHRLEGVTENALLHGEAVAIGVALDTRISVRRGLLRPGVDARVHALLRRLGFATWHPVLADPGALALVDGLEEFREHMGGALTLIMLRGIGEPTEVHELPVPDIVEAVQWLHGLEREAGRSRAPQPLGA